ncbi:MAG TPA: hypothetical protein VFR41_14240 [Acidimicrobiia bacterium]|nr:hypothetical protein [Acidimicrobiia bacterium]
MRPTHLMSVVTAVIVALCVAVLGVWILVDRSSGRQWFYWISPLLVIAVAGLLLQLVAMYFIKVGRLELKGRPRK